MKKLYKKPIVIIESFEISEFIAGSCTIDVGFGDGLDSSKPCTILHGSTGFMMFNLDNICEALWDDGDDKGCYHIPDGGYGYFGS